MYSQTVILNRWAWLRWSTRRCYLWRSWTMTNDSKHIQANFLLIPTDWLCLWVAQKQISRSGNFRGDNLRTDWRTDRPITLPLRMHVWAIRRAEIKRGLTHKYWCSPSPPPPHTHSQNLENNYHRSGFECVVTPRACTKGKAIGLYVCRRCRPHENRQYEHSRPLSDL